MGKIFYIMGKSSTGKDTIYKRLLQNTDLHLQRMVPYTTRPIRVGETDGIEYHFTDEAGLKLLTEQGKVIELREYNTCHGIWRYFTVADEKLDLSKYSYILIGTVHSYLDSRQYFGEDTIIPILIELNDCVRLQRALNREKKQENPRYEELCRRFLADATDFSTERIKAAGITKSFNNDDLTRCLQEITEYIQWTLR